jgi:uncharacterized protein (DUF1697 family)
MPSYAAFLRGINLGGHHRVTSAELCALFEEMGLREVAAFRASGNVVFTAGRESRAALSKRIERSLAKALGYEVATFLRTADEVRAIAALEPFPAKAVTASDGKLQVLILAGKPAKSSRTEVLGMATDEDRLAFGDRELYWLPSGGMRDSALNLRAIEKLLGPTTMRTKGTVDQIAAKHFSD